ncbi:hypothetical protein QFC22_001316 [Naganishia vaughanmartiniae]|uniref:Uncharacterized protein n=1 Tax=Naganishia vaughanmartiniae TaxID=1424756 RepID=A0ACC2XHR1_9TREE|nr:hypothetical protein QFC22_001316 [Naganishia vaughanmartiniae]
MSRQQIDADGFPLLPQSSSSGSTIRMVSAQNQVQLAPPTEASGLADTGRVNFHRHATGENVSGVAKPSSRRANSVSSVGKPSTLLYEDTLLEPIRNLNIVPMKQKVGSRHADVIDKWDGSGVGKSMWHHSGPYDAAAPSRNDIKKVGQTRAPMKAFRDVAGGADVPENSAGMRQNNLSSASGSDAMQNPFDDSSAVPPMYPVDSDYGVGASSTEMSRPPHKTHHKKHSSKHGGKVMSPRGEGLTGQYSTSLPASGGYFPTHASGGAGVEEDEWELDEGKRRQRERDQKHRALQAAWGIDEPEPFEEFGYSPRHEEPDTYKGPMSPDSTTPFVHSVQPQPVRSPSFQLGLNSNQMSSGDYVVTTPGFNGEATSPTSAQSGVAKAPLKRTRSLMQRLRAMRDSPNVPANAYQHDGQRSTSPSSPYAEEPMPMGIKGSVPEGDESPRTASSASTHQSATGATSKRRNSFLKRNPMRMNSSSGGYASPAKTPVDDFKSSDGTYEKEEMLATPSKEFPGTPPVVVEARATPTPTKSILKNSTGYFPSSSGYGLASDSNNYQTSARVRTDGREKALPPPPPPPGPVMPDWHAPIEDDYRSRARDDPAQNGYLRPNTSENAGGANVKRKTSMLKKMKDRITKQ